MRFASLRAFARGAYDLRHVLLVLALSLLPPLGVSSVLAAADGPPVELPAPADELAIPTQALRFTLRALVTEGVGLLVLAVFLVGAGAIWYACVKAVVAYVKGRAEAAANDRNTSKGLDQRMERLFDALNGLLQQQATGSGEARRDRREIADAITAAVTEAVRDAVSPMVAELKALTCRVEEFNNHCQQQHRETAASLVAIQGFDQTRPGGV